VHVSNDLVTRLINIHEVHGIYNLQHMLSYDELAHLVIFKPVFHLRIFSREANFSFVFVSQLEPSGTNWMKTKENFASREKIRKWKTGLRPDSTGAFEF
jgi:hypothetical protein